MTDAQLGERLRFELDTVRQSQRHGVAGLGSLSEPRETSLVLGAPPASGQRPSGGYRFDPDGLNEIIEECKELRDDLARDDQRYAKLADVRPPAPDEYASGLHARAVNTFGENQLRRNKAWREFLHDYIGRLEQTREQYLAQGGS
ncbi:MAG: hypothetical protein ACRDQ5_02240 [Sciscionella sp.]